MAYGFEAYNSSGGLILSVTDRAGFVATTVTTSVTGGSVASPGITNVNLSTAFDTGGVSTGDVVLILTERNDVTAEIILNGSSPLYTVRFKKSTAGSVSVSAAVVHFGGSD
jgi:hypothetical protein